MWQILGLNPVRWSGATYKWTKGENWQFSAVIKKVILTRVHKKINPWVGLFSFAIGQFSYYFQKVVIMFSLFSNCTTSMATKDTDRRQTCSCMAERTHRQRTEKAFWKLWNVRCGKHRFIRRTRNNWRTELYFRKRGTQKMKHTSGCGVWQLSYWKWEKCHPVKWSNLLNRSIDILIEKGPLQILRYDFDFPKNSDNRI
jgi:hypothetical protein